MYKLFPPQFLCIAIIFWPLHMIQGKIRAVIAKFNPIYFWPISQP